MAEPAELALLAASIAVAVALVVVTYYLVRHTQNLARATDELRRIEQRRDRAEARRRRIAQFKRKIELTQLLLGWKFEAWRHNYLVQGAYPPEGGHIQELATLLEYGKDHANRELVEGIVRVLNSLVQDKAPIVGDPADKFIEELGHLTKLRQDIPRWQGELMALTTEETASLVEAVEAH